MTTDVDVDDSSFSIKESDVDDERRKRRIININRRKDYFESPHRQTQEHQALLILRTNSARSSIELHRRDEMADRSNKNREMNDEITPFSVKHRRNQSFDLQPSTKLDVPAGGGVSSWAPRKLSEGNILDSGIEHNVATTMTAGGGGRARANVAKRKLSESRGVNLPDIRIIQPNTPKSSFKSIGTSSSVVVQPTNVEPATPMTGSPVGYVMRHPQLTVNTSASAVRPGSPSNSAKSNVNAVINICVFLSNHRGIQFTIEGGCAATADCLIEMVSEQLYIPLDISRHAFALWMISPLLEVQLKPHHCAFDIRRNWSSLVRKFTDAASDDIDLDEPVLVFKRNVLLTIELEKTLIYDYESAVEVLFFDAKDEVLAGRYLCDVQMSIQLAALDMAITLGPFDAHEHTFAFIRDCIDSFLPAHQATVAKSFAIFGYPVVGCRGLENDLISEYQRVSHAYDDQHSRRKAYLGILSSLPFYGSAFFRGQIERPPASLRDLKRLLQAALPDIQVLVGVNRECITVIDQHKHELLIVESIFDCSWRRFECDDDKNASAMPSFFLHFPDDCREQRATSNSSKLLQIFSRQAVMIEALLNAVYHCAEIDEVNNATVVVDDDGDVAYVDVDDDEEEEDDVAIDEHDGDIDVHHDTIANGIVDHRTASPTLLANKCNRLCLATFDQSGNCIEAQGSLRRVLQDCH